MAQSPVTADTREVENVEFALRAVIRNVKTLDNIIQGSALDGRTATKAFQGVAKELRPKLKQLATVGAPGRRLKLKSAYRVRVAPSKRGTRKFAGRPPFLKVKAGVLSKTANPNSLAYDVGFFSNYVNVGTKQRFNRRGQPAGRIVGSRWLYRAQALMAPGVADAVPKHIEAEMQTLFDKLAAKGIYFNRGELNTAVRNINEKAFNELN